MPGARTRCYAENEATYVLWDEVQESDCSMCKSIEPLKENKFNKTCEGAWKKEDEIDYGYEAMPICDNWSAISTFF